MPPPTDLMVMRVRPDTPRGPIIPGEFTVGWGWVLEPRCPDAQREALQPGP